MRGRRHMRRTYRGIFYGAMIALLFAAASPCYSQEAFKKGMNDVQRIESAVASSGQRVPIITRPKLVYDAGELKDPFDDFLPKVKPKPSSRMPGVGTEMPAVPLPSFSVQGLIWGGSMPQAVIDGQVLKVGDTIQDAEIVEINKDGVKLLYNKKIYKLGPPSSAAPDANASKNK
jgi:hypothetical protein